MEAYRQLAMMGPTVIIGDFSAAPSADDRKGRQTPEDTAVQMAMQHIGLQDLTASLRGQPSHRPPQPGSADSRIDLCYADSAHIEVAGARYDDLPSKVTRHRPLAVQIKVLRVPPASTEDMHHDKQPPIRPPDQQDTHRWMAYCRTVQRILDQQGKTDLNLAMRQAAMACALHGGHWCAQGDATPHQDLRSLDIAIWRDKRALHTAVHSHDSQAQHDAQDIAARLDTTRQQLREWHVRRAKELAQEQQRYFQNPQPYKSLKHVDKVLGETSHRCTKAVRLQDGTVTNDPRVVLQEVLNSFQRQHNTEDEELSAYTEELISHLPKLYNRTKRRDMHRNPFTIWEFDECCTNYNREKPRGGRTPGRIYRRLPLNLKRHLAARLWDVAIGKTDVPPDWVNLVHPLYKKGDWANPDSWRPIVCATRAAKIIWMLILKRVAPAVYRAIMPTMWGAIPGR